MLRICSQNVKKMRRIFSSNTHETHKICLKRLENAQNVLMKCTKMVRHCSKNLQKMFQIHKWNHYSFIYCIRFD